jgi:hypothetical protein
MSVETAFRALLVADAGVTALVAGRIAQNAVPQDAPRPYVVFAAQHQLDFGLDNTVHADAVTITAECWADTAAQADAVADAVQAALLAAGRVCTARATSYDPEVGADATVLTVEWWDA